MPIDVYFDELLKTAPARARVVCNMSFSHQLAFKVLCQCRQAKVQMSHITQHLNSANMVVSFQHAHQTIEPMTAMMAQDLNRELENDFDQRPGKVRERHEKTWLSM